MELATHQGRCFFAAEGRATLEHSEAVDHNRRMLIEVGPRFDHFVLVCVPSVSK